jgi:3-phosphoshikimate 1-carboxyvinyltransferase
MDRLELAQANRCAGAVKLPGSKSLTIRSLMLAALSEGTTLLSNVLDSDDARVMLGALAQLGVRLDDLGDQRWRVMGNAPFPAHEASIFVGNSGLSIRTLAAVLAFMPGSWRLHGVPRMHERPIGDLTDALVGVGAQVEFEGAAGFPPLVLHGRAPAAGEIRLRVKGNASSQFLTGLLQVGPIAARTGDFVIEVEGELISKPYVEMTLGLMRRFGVAVQRDGYREFAIPTGSHYRSPGEYMVESDASSASYFLAAGLLGGGPVRVEGVGSTSLQGDIGFAQFLGRVGAQVQWGSDWIETRRAGSIRAFDEDFNTIPDAAMTAAVVALYADGPCRLRNIASWRVKETDRLAAMASELRKCGAQVEEGPDWLGIVPPKQVQRADIATYDDHRMAMSFSLVRFASPVVIEDPGCTAKTYPAFFEDMAKVIQ